MVDGRMVEKDDWMVIFTWDKRKVGGEKRK